ncbi:MAG: ABC transporter permease [Acidimicrobiales bacterium]
MILRRIGYTAAAPAASLVIGFGIAAVILAVSGNNPWTAYSTMFEAATRLEVMVDIVNRATPLYIAGVAAAIGFRMNIFNIGVEGQYIVAGLLAAKTGAEIDLPAPLHLLVIILVAMASGAVWALIPAILAVTRNVHIVISTIMLNAIGVGFVVAYLLPRWDEPDASLNTETKTIPESGRFPELNRFVEWFTRDIGAGRSVLGFVIVAAIVGVLFHLYVNRTTAGYDLRASGMNPLAAEVSGAAESRMVIQAMVLSGAVAGLIGLPEILGVDYAYGLQFTKGLGFLGLGVALLGRNHPGGIMVAALIFAFLDSTGASLQFEAGAPPEIIAIMQGIIVLAAVIVYEVVRRRREADETRRAAIALAKKQGEPIPEGLGA